MQTPGLSYVKGTVQHSDSHFKNLFTLTVFTWFSGFCLLKQLHNIKTVNHFWVYKQQNYIKTTSGEEEDNRYFTIKSTKIRSAMYSETSSFKPMDPRECLSCLKFPATLNEQLQHQIDWAHWAALLLLHTLDTVWKTLSFGGRSHLKQKEMSLHIDCA